MASLGIFHIHRASGGGASISQNVSIISAAYIIVVNDERWRCFQGGRSNGEKGRHGGRGGAAAAATKNGSKRSDSRYSHSLFS